MHMHFIFMCYAQKLFFMSVKNAITSSTISQILYLIKEHYLNSKFSWSVFLLFLTLLLTDFQFYTDQSNEIFMQPDMD
jgi:hypothetical protein